MQSPIFTQRGFEVGGLGLNLSSVQVKFHIYLRIFHKLLGWISRRLFAGGVEYSYEGELLLE